MNDAAHSAYIRYNNQSALVRRWIAMILLQSDLESQVMFSGLDPILTRGFDTSAFNKDNREDAEFIRAWLASELERCGKENFDEGDTFAINTRRIQKSMGLNKVELAVLRFACLVNCYKPLEAASELGGNCLAEPMASATRRISLMSAGWRTALTLGRSRFAMRRMISFSSGLSG